MTVHLSSWAIFFRELSRLAELISPESKSKSTIRIQSWMEKCSRFGLQVVQRIPASRRAWVIEGITLTKWVWHRTVKKKTKGYRTFTEHLRRWSSSVHAHASRGYASSLLSSTTYRSCWTSPVRSRRACWRRRMEPSIHPLCFQCWNVITWLLYRIGNIRIIGTILRIRLLIFINKFREQLLANQGWVVTNYSRRKTRWGGASTY